MCVFVRICTIFETSDHMTNKAQIHKTETDIQAHVQVQNVISC